MQVLDCQLANENAAVELVDNQPFVAEQSECLAKRVSRDLEGSPNRLLGEAGAGWYVTLNDARPHYLGDTLDRIDPTQQLSILLKVRPFHR